jgi:thiamine-monophosphate kinase
MAKSKISLIQELLSQTTASPFNNIIFDNQEYVFTSSHKLLLEGTDFDLVYTPLNHLGYKAVLSAFGPLYAKGFTPHSLSVRIGMSKKIGTTQLEELWQGISAALKEHSVEYIELDLLSSLTGLTISLSSQGKQKRETFVQHNSCKSGDLLCLTGSVGAAYLGLQILEREKRIFEERGVQPKLEKYKPILRAFLNPELDKTLPDLMTSAGIFPSEGDFVINGLADSVKSICGRNNLGAKIFMNRIPVFSAAMEVAEELNIDPMTAAMNGGEDYRILFAIPQSQYEAVQKELPQLDIVGHLCDISAGTKFITPDGSEIELKAQAWNETE